MTRLQFEILQDPLVNSVMESQSEDGWFGPRFHGYNSLESGIRILVEKGVSNQHPALALAFDALEHDTEKIDNDLGSFGRYFDENRLGGARMIQAWLLASGGRHDHPLVLEQVDVAFEGMKSVIALKDFSDAVVMFRGKLVYTPGLKWPGIYHFRLLASTHSWQTPENMITVSEAIKKLTQFSPMPYAYVRKGSQLIAPASFAMLDQNSDLTNLDSIGWMMWFHRMELLTRMGVTHRIESLIQQLDYLFNLLTHNEFIFPLPLKHDYFTRWGAYTGLMLEPNWKDTSSRINDLTFRSHLILNQYLMNKEPQS